MKKLSRQQRVLRSRKPEKQKQLISEFCYISHKPLRREGNQVNSGSEEPGLHLF